MKVSVIGGGGHVGLGMCLVLANAGHTVDGIDIDEEKIRLINSGKMPFKEEQGEEYLQRALEKKALAMTSDLAIVSNSKVIVVIIGTPIDENFNPVTKPLKDITLSIIPYLKPGQIVILRSTLSPGTTDLIKNLISDNSDLKVGRDIDLVFAPERVTEGKAITELKSLPQLIGAYDDGGYSRAESFFNTYLEAKCIRLTPLEAEIGKLITNMTRYVSFALSNEYHLIAETFGVNINKIIDASNEGYPRLNLPKPGPNVGGPCLYKDGWFLIDRIPYIELIGTAFRINEGMPLQIIMKIKQHPQIRKITILGMTFKADSDDTRNSLSFKLEKQLESLQYNLVTIEPHLEGYDAMSALKGSEAVILMTPHTEFKDLHRIMLEVDNPECFYVDIWGFWDIMKYSSDNGYFFGKDVPQ